MDVELECSSVLDGDISGRFGARMVRWDFFLLKMGETGDSSHSTVSTELAYCSCVHTNVRIAKLGGRNKNWRTV